MEISDAWLRNRQQLLLLSFLAEITRDQSLDDFVFNLFGETLANDRRRNFALAKTRDARQFLIAVHDALGLRVD